jgi:hypothetical protein
MFYFFIECFLQRSLQKKKRVAKAYIQGDIQRIPDWAHTHACLGKHGDDEKSG